MNFQPVFFNDLAFVGPGPLFDRLDPRLGQVHFKPLVLGPYLLLEAFLVEVIVGDVEVSQDFLEKGLQGYFADRLAQLFANGRGQTLGGNHIDRRGGQLGAADLLQRRHVGKRGMAFLRVDLKEKAEDPLSHVNALAGAGGEVRVTAHEHGAGVGAPFGGHMSAGETLAQR